MTPMNSHEDQDELALGDQVGLAGLVDQLRDLAHRPVDRQVLELAVDDQAEDQPEDADDEARAAGACARSCRRSSPVRGRARSGSPRRRRAWRAPPRPRLPARRGRRRRLGQRGGHRDGEEGEEKQHRTSSAAARRYVKSVPFMCGSLLCDSSTLVGTDADWSAVYTARSALESTQRGTGANFASPLDFVCEGAGDPRTYTSRSSTRFTDGQRYPLGA